MSLFPIDPRAPKGAAYERPYVYHIIGDPIARMAFKKPDAVQQRMIDGKRAEDKRIYTRERPW